MKKFFLVLTVLFSLFFPSFAFAQGEFATNSTVTYDIHENGKAYVTHNISLQNLFSDRYAITYSLSLDGLKITNPHATENSKPLNLETLSDNSNTTLKITFSDPLVGKGKSRNFQITFEADSLAVKTGEVWEISTPKATKFSQLAAAENSGAYTTRLVVPNAFGDAAYIAPNPVSRTSENGKQYFTFSKEDMQKSGVSAAFGQFQVFSFDLTYHLENPLNRAAYADIAIPPDTAFQKVNFSALSPTPENVYVDNDGNWLARYYLNPKQRVDVKATGSVQIFSTARPYLQPSTQNLENNKKPSDVWQTEDPQIKNLALTLRTPRAIYDYVVSTLNYDYERVKPNAARLGAKAALENPNTAICMEFTDLFVALARAAGIPAREVNGFAYTENQQLQPLSLVADVLHAWPEYWDSQKRAWIPVDPTWGSTTGGIDFFSKLDLKHFTFVVHGEDAHKPFAPGSYKLGPNPQKDVFVAFGKLPDIRDPKIEVNSQNGSFTISNLGPVAVYNQSANLYFDKEFHTDHYLPLLPPYSKFTKAIDTPFSLFGNNLPAEIHIKFMNETHAFPGPRPTVIIRNLIIFLVILFTLTAIIFWKVRKSKNGKTKKST